MKSLNRYHATIEEWKHCPMANYTCPVHRVTHLESLSPRGLALLMGNIDSFSGEEKQKAVEKVFQCSMCRLCQPKSMDETSVPDAVATFRWKCWQSGIVPQSLSRHFPRLQNVAKDIEHFTLSESLEDGKILFLVDPFTTELGTGVLQKVAQEFAFTIVFLPASFVFLYNWGLWDPLRELSKKLEQLENFSGEVLVESSLDRFIFQEMELRVNVKEIASYFCQKGLLLQGLKGKKAIVIPDMPENDVRKPRSAFCQLLLSAGVRHYAIELPETIPITPKEFPPYRDVFHARLFTDVARQIVAETFSYALLYDAEMVITESLETAWVLREFRDVKKELKVVDLMTLACLGGA